MRARGRQRSIGVLASVLITAWLPGCGLDVAGPSLVLRLVTPDRATEPTGPMVQHFVDEVDQLSDGTIRIEPVWDFTPDDAVDWDVTVAGAVMDGTYELGLVPGRTWDLLEVETLRALNAPFLISSTDHLHTVLQDDELREQLLAGLPDAGVVGVDLFPDGLRHPFGYDRPLLDVKDYAGSVIRSPDSATVSALLEVLGATPSEEPPGPGQRGAESEYSRTPAGIATGNVVFFPKTDALVVGQAVRERLRADQWSLLRTAASTTREWLVAQQESDFEAAVRFCEKGGRVRAASARQVRALEEAAGPVTAMLRDDPVTARLIDDIDDLADALPQPEPVLGCPGDSLVDHETAALDGRYRTRVTAQAFREVGINDFTNIRENTGRFLWTLDSGRWTYRQRANHFVRNPTGSGSFTWHDGLFTLYWDDVGYVTARLRIAKDGSITFFDVKDSDPALDALSQGFFGGRPWWRVGDLPD